MACEGNVLVTIPLSALLATKLPSVRLPRKSPNMPRCVAISYSGRWFVTYYPVLGELWFDIF